MRIRKLIISMLLILSLILSPCFAAISTQVTASDDGKILVQGSSSYKERPVAIKVEEGNKKAYIDQQKTDGEGNFKFQFEVDKGKYYVGKINIDGETAAFSFSTGGQKPEDKENKLGDRVKIEKGKPAVFEGGISLDFGQLAIPSEAALTLTDETSEGKYKPSQGSGLAAPARVLRYSFEGITINSPVKIRIPMPQGVNKDKASIYYFNEASKKWEYISSQYENGLFSAGVNHFSAYGVLEDNKAPVNVGIKVNSNVKNAVVLGLSAEDDSGIKEYELYRDGSLIGKTSGSTYTDTSALAGQKYSYKAIATDNLNNRSSYSTAVEVSVPDDGAKSVTVTIRIEGYYKTIVPKQTITVDNFDLSPYLGKASGSSATPSTGWGPDKLKEPRVAHAVIKALEDQGVNCKDHKKGLDMQDYGWSLYIAMISGDREFDHKSTSGWLYRVNDYFPNYGCQDYKLKDGDDILWYFGADGGDTPVGKLNASKTSVAVGEEVEITLTGLSTSMSTGASVTKPMKNAAVYADGKSYTTDDLGKVKIKFEKEGTYEITADRLDSKGIRNIARPLPIKITVSGSSNPGTIEGKLNTPIKLEQGKSIAIEGGITISLGDNTVPKDALVTVKDVTGDYAYTPSEAMKLSIGGKLLEFKFEGIQISKPVEIKIPAKKDINKDKASIFHFNNQTKKWVYIPSQYADGVFTASVNSFSAYGVLVDETAPTNVKLNIKSNENNTVQLELEAQDSSGIKEYEIYRAGVLIGRTKENIYKDEKLETGKKYSYKLKAVDNLNNKSEYSEAVEATVNGGQSKDYRKLVSESIEGTCSVVTDKHYSWDWAAVGLSRAGKADKIYKAYLSDTEKYLKNPENADTFSRKPTEYERITLGVLSAGGEPTNIGGINLIEKIYNADLEKQGNNAIIFALIAFDSKGYKLPASAKWTREKLIAEILNQECTNEENQYGKKGGWAFSGTMGDPDMTGMAMTALAPYYSKRADVKAAVDRAADYLSAIQRDDGGYASWGSVNSESCAQVIMGLCTNGFDPSGPKFTKNNNTVIDGLMKFKKDDGGFCHILESGHDETNGMATEQALYALDQYIYYLDGKGSIYWWGDKNHNIENELGVQVKLEQGKTVNFKGGIAVSLGENAVPANASLTVSDKSNDTKYQPSQGSGLLMGGKILEYKFNGMHISKPVEIKIPTNSGANKDKASIYYYNESLNKWEYVASKYAGGVLSSNVNHFSAYGVLVDQTAPVNVQLKLTSNAKYAVVLGFGAEDASGIKEYEIYRNDTLIGKTAGSSYTDTTAEAGKKYAYKIIAVDNLNNKSAQSAVLEVTVPADSTSGGSSGSGGRRGGGGGGSSSSTTASESQSEKVKKAANNLLEDAKKLGTQDDVNKLLAKVESMGADISKVSGKNASAYDLENALYSWSKISEALAEVSTKANEGGSRKKTGEALLKAISAAEQIIIGISDRSKQDDTLSKLIDASYKTAKKLGGKDYEAINKGILGLSNKAVQGMKKEKLNEGYIKTIGSSVSAQITSDTLTTLAIKAMRTVSIMERKLDENGVERNKAFKKEIVIEIPSEGKSKVEAILSAGAIKNLAAGVNRITIKTGLGSFTLAPEVFTEAQRDKEIRLTVQKEESTQTSGEAGVSLEIKVGAEKITKLVKPIEASLPYAGSLENKNSITVFLKKADGKAEPAGGVYCEEEKAVKFITAKAGKYYAKSSKKQFSDMEKAKWAVEAAELLAGKGIMSGKSETSFEPNTTITKAELADYVNRMVKYDCIDSAGGEGTVTREEMAVIVMKVLGKNGYLAEKSSNTDKFKDKGSISAEAKTAAATVVREGIITAAQDGSFAPKAKVTRAQAAIILKRLNDAIMQ